MVNFSFMWTVSSIFMVSCGLWSFVYYHKHLLNSLLSLEFMMLGIFWLLSMHMSSIGEEIFFSLYFLTLAACEGALGLSLLVFVVRTHGNDCFMSFNFLEC
uniref:NADH dehydrogenase subunit 4L n=1 Tax=Eucrate crenata TaxID=486106 RepID=UPI0021CC9E5F|nr:NADH dehydrogenase subunit 4L [Eucrate crenata]UWM93446.1 NADH dehydrogenase subunit 4L [Eucrate crenata]WAK85102.1 NADH dehydrogenase subunit 4L [Eucrate crenata]